MTPKPATARAYTAAALLSLATAPAAFAQAAPPAPAPATADEEVVVLSPFVVNATEDKGYRATSTLAGTRIRTELKDVGSAISVVTEQFLKDTGSRNSEDLLVYTTSTEVGGTSGNFAGVSGTQASTTEGPTMLRPNTNTRVRGLAAADNTRDFFITDIPWDSYNVGRVDLQRGPNAILFGLGSPAGIINSSTNGAALQDTNTLETRYGSYGSFRASLDVNKVLLKDELAVRLDLLHDKTYFQQKPAYNRDQRLFAALRYDPAVLNRGSAHTSIRVNYEHGDIDSNRPRTTPPVDAITPWTSAMHKALVDPVYAQTVVTSVPTSGAQSVGSPNYNPWLRQIYGGPYAYFTDPNSSAESGNLMIPAVQGWSDQFGRKNDGTIDNAINASLFNQRQLMVQTTSGWASQAKVEYYGQYQDKSLTDTGVFDFYHKLLDGPNKHETRDFESFNANLSQTFLNNRLGFEAVVDSQDYADSQNSIFSGSPTISVDVNTLNPDGTPNRQAGRAIVVGRSLFGNTGRATHRDAVRLTAFGELKAEDFMQKSWATKLLGRHVFTGMYSSDRSDVETLQWVRYATSENLSPILGRGYAFDPVREIQVISYLGTAGQVTGLPNITAVQSPTATAIHAFDSHWNKPLDSAAAGYVAFNAPWADSLTGNAANQADNPANYAGWTDYGITVLDAAKGDRDQLLTTARKDRTKIKSQALVWQGFFLDETIVPTFGYRKDKAKSYGVDAPTSAFTYRDARSDAYTYKDAPDSVLTGITRSWSVVVHTPKFLRDRLPWGTNLSLTYNTSKNFQPIGRTDWLNQPLAAPSGDTRDVGIVLSTLDNKLTFRVNRYKTNSVNTSLQITNAYYLGSAECRGWVLAQRYAHGLSDPANFAGASFNFGTNNNGFVQTAADRAAQQTAVNAALAGLPGGDAIWDAWHFTKSYNRWYQGWWDPWSNEGGAQPGTGSATTDATSKGTEYEISFEPTPSLNVSLNASKTDAKRYNIGGETLNQWVADRNAVWQGPAGDLRSWNGVNSQTLRDDWNQTFYQAYHLLRAQEGLTVPDLRPWHVNLVANYSFRSGFLKDVNVGGAFRWADRNIIGYKSMHETVAGRQEDTYDMSQPIHGQSETTYDLWTGYERALTAKIKWRIQLNVKNVFGKNEIVPLSINPDGTFALYRIKEGPTWSLTNTFKF